MEKGEIFTSDKNDLKVEVYEDETNAYLEVKGTEEINGTDQTVFISLGINRIIDWIKTLTAAKDAMEKGE